MLGRRASFLLTGKLRTMRVSCYYGKVAIVLDGRPSRPATDGKLSVAGTVATAASVSYCRGKPLFQPSIQPHTRVLRVLVGKFPHYREGRSKAISAAVGARIPAVVSFSGRMLYTGNFFLLLRSQEGESREASRTPRQSLQNRGVAVLKSKICSQNPALSTGHYAAVGAAHIEVGNATSRLYPLPMGTSRTNGT